MSKTPKSTKRLMITIGIISWLGLFAAIRPHFHAGAQTVFLLGPLAVEFPSAEEAPADGAVVVLRAGVEELFDVLGFIGVGLVALGDGGVRLHEKSGLCGRGCKECGCRMATPGAQATGRRVRPAGVCMENFLKHGWRC